VLPDSVPYIVPVARISPFTSNLYNGLVVPIPKELFIIIVPSGFEYITFPSYVYCQILNPPSNFVEYSTLLEISSFGSIAIPAPAF